ncbi:MAG: hypothetical protein V4555_14515 [Acidobacteriota bacterium]
MLRVLLNGGGKMSIRNENFWRRPFSKRGKRNFLVVAILAIIFFEVWLGWTRLFVIHDRQYQIVFLLFIGGTVILFSAVSAVSSRAYSATNWRTFNILRTLIGALSLLAWVGSGLFYDYTKSRFDSTDMVETVVVGTTMAIWNAMSMTRPKLENAS